jgi:hypothetical protein
MEHKTTVEKDAAYSEISSLHLTQLVNSLQRGMTSHTCPLPIILHMHRAQPLFHRCENAAPSCTDNVLATHRLLLFEENSLPSTISKPVFVGLMEFLSEYDDWATVCSLVLDHNENVTCLEKFAFLLVTKRFVTNCTAFRGMLQLIMVGIVFSWPSVRKGSNLL